MDEASSSSCSAPSSPERKHEALNVETDDGSPGGDRKRVADSEDPLDACISPTDHESIEKLVLEREKEALSKMREAAFEAMEKRLALQAEKGGLSKLNLSPAESEAMALEAEKAALSKMRLSYMNMMSDDDDVGKLIPPEEPDVYMEAWSDDVSSVTMTTMHTMEQKDLTKKKAASEGGFFSPRRWGLGRVESGIAESERVKEEVHHIDTTEGIIVEEPEVPPTPEQSFDLEEKGEEGEEEAMGAPTSLTSRSGRVSAKSSESSQGSKDRQRRRKKCLIILAVLLLVLIGVVLGVVLPMDDDRGGSGDADKSIGGDNTAAEVPSEESTPSPTNGGDMASTESPTSPSPAKPAPTSSSTTPSPSKSPAPSVPPTISTTQAPSTTPTVSPPTDPYPTSAPTKVPTSAPLHDYPSLLALLEERSPKTIPMLSNETTPQARAYEWLLPSFHDYSVHRLIQRYALGTFFYATYEYLHPETGIVMAWADNFGWMKEGHECLWTRIWCNDKGEVVDLPMFANRVGGHLPRELTLLTSLKFLHFRSNYMQMPVGDLAFLGELTDLRGISLGESYLYNRPDEPVIPTEFAKLVKLEEFEMSLTDLDIFYDNVTNPNPTIPDIFGQMPNLRKIEFSVNKLTGATLPPSVFNLTNLDTLTMGRNKLRGDMSFLQKVNWPAIKILSLVGNQFEGEIPAEVGLLPELEILDLSENRLHGPLPSEIGNLANLEQLYIQENMLDGNIPSEIGKNTMLAVMEFQTNEFISPFPDEICSLWDNSLTKLSGDCKETGCECCRFCFDPPE